jgi:NADH pyrophosphatase NudC (nudix superfamily)
MRPTPFEFAARWRDVSEELMAGIEEWRLQHPKATLQEIEAAVETRLAELRTRMRQDVVLASQAAEVSQARGPDRPKCPHCGTAVEPRGPRERQVMTHQGQTLRLRRSDVMCPTCQVRCFPPR